MWPRTPSKADLRSDPQNEYGPAEGVSDVPNFSREYRLDRRDAQGPVVKENDLLMNCLRSFVCPGVTACGRNRLPRRQLLL